MKTRERAIMDYTRRMGELGAEHTEALTDATLSYLEYLQAGNSRSATQRDKAEELWRVAVWEAYKSWKEGRTKAQAALDRALDADPAIES